MCLLYTYILWILVIIICTGNDVVDLVAWPSQASTKIASAGDMLDVLGSDLLDPILALNSSTEGDLDNLQSKVHVQSITHSQHEVLCAACGGLCSSPFSGPTPSGIVLSFPRSPCSSSGRPKP